MNEFSIEWIKGSDYAGITVPSGTALKPKLLRLGDENPDEVKIIVENREGSLFAHVPVNYIKISPPEKVSEEQKKLPVRDLSKCEKKNKWKDEINIL